MFYELFTLCYYVLAVSVHHTEFFIYKILFTLNFTAQTPLFTSKAIYIKASKEQAKKDGDHRIKLFLHDTQLTTKT